MNTPKKPLFKTASCTPFASEYPNPLKGTVAPAPAHSTSGSYRPSAVRMTPDVTYPTRIRAGVNFVLSISTCPIRHSAPPTRNAFRYSTQPPFSVSFQVSYSRKFPENTCTGRLWYILFYRAERKISNASGFCRLSEIGLPWGLIKQWVLSPSARSSPVSLSST